MNDKENNSRELNKDYIAVVHKNEDGKLSYNEINIKQKDKGLISLIRSCSQHKDIPLTDIEEVFSRIYTGKPVEYSYCIPYEYDATFIDHATYPKLYSKKELEKEIEEKKQDFINETIEKIKKEKNYSSDDTLAEEELDLIRNEANEFVSKHVVALRDEFTNTAIRYIMAASFKDAIASIKSDENNIMFSTEVIGWTTYNYQVNNDLSILVKTNFCYGRSTYFHVTLIFKDVEILAYSKLVQYYYANMLDFMDCTVSYDRERNSWKTALQFVVETANFAIDDEDAFVNKWIIESVRNLVTGLNDILHQPDYVMGELLKRKLDDQQLYAVRNITDEEISEYKVYPKEMAIAFQAEKISGALLLINNLEKLTELYKEIVPAIQEIKRINKDLFPALHSNIKEIEKKIADVSIKRTEIEKEYFKFKKSNWDFFREIWKIRKKCRENKQEAIDKYINSENKVVYAEAKSFEEKIANIEAEEKRLTSFRFNLYKCAQLICDYGLAEDYEKTYLSGNLSNLQERISIKEGHVNMSKNRRRLIRYNNTYGEDEINLPNTIWVICNSAFYNCQWMKKIKMPTSLRIIGSSAFEKCKNITEIILPDCVEEIGDSLFFQCSNLRSVRLPRNIKKIGAWSFFDCSVLTTIDLPNSVIEIGDNAFSQCKSLIDIHLPSSINKIGRCIFDGCESLRKIYVPKNKKTTFEKMLWPYTDKIVEEFTAFSECIEENCLRVRSTKVENASGYINDEPECHKDIADTELKDTYVDEYGVKYSKDKKVLLDCNCTLDKYNIPSGVIEIRDKAFFTAKIGTVYLPCTLETIGYRGLFSYGIENIECSNYNHSFMSWHGVLYSKDMKELVAYPQGRNDVLYRLPQKTLKIAEGVFSTFKDTSYIMKAHSVMSMEPDAYEECGFCSDREKLFLQDNQEIINYPYVIVFPNANRTVVDYCVISNEMCYVDENGVVYDRKKKKLLFFHPALHINDYTVIDGCEEIQEGAFPSFGYFDPHTEGRKSINNSIKNITLPDSLHSVNGNPFKDCASLISIYVPNGEVESFKGILPQELHSKIRTLCKE